MTIAYASKTHRQRLRSVLGGSLLACASTFALAAAAAEVPSVDAPLAAEAPPAEADGATALEAVIVTGVRGVRRTVADSPAPVDVISSQQLTATGKVGLKEVLNTLIPSFNLPGVNGGGTSWTVRAITMRGLNGDQALFLVNGKRRHGTALINNLARVGRGGSPVDLDLIPASAIDRIEVLRDGASAQYGSDAIAGVINIILKKDAEGGSFSYTGGQNYLGDGDTRSATLNYGLPLGDQGGFVQLALNWKNNEAASRSVPSRAQYIFQPTVTTVGGVTTVTPDPRDATADRYFWGHGYGPGEEDILAASYNAELPWKDLTLYSAGTLSHRGSKKNTGSFLPNLAPVAGVTPGRPLNRNSLPEVYPYGFNALRRIFETDFQTSFGARGQARGWDWDVSTTLAQDHAQLDGQNTLNATLGPASPTYFHLSTHEFQQWTNNLDVTRAFDGVLPHPVQVSWGLEHRYERFKVEAGDEASYVVGDYVIPAGQPFAGLRPNPGLASYAGTAPDDAGSANRNSYAAYVDVGTDLTDTWYVGLAARHERYTGDVGDTTSGKLTTRWEFLPGYAVRATVSNGFRAPSLGQEVFASSTISGSLCAAAPNNVFRGVACTPGEYLTFPTKVLRPGSAEAAALGATPLKPETSTNYSFGITAEPTSRLRVTLDAYQIDIDDRIVDTSNLDLSATQLASQPALAPLLSRFPQGLTATYYTNAVSTRTTGVDLVGEYSLDLGDWGRVNLNAAYAFNKTKITKRQATPAVLLAVNPNLVLFDRQKVADLTVGTPREKVVLGALWNRDAVTASLRATRYGRYTEAGTSANLDRAYSAKWVADLDVSYDVRESTTVAIGANNLFDQHPDKIGVINPDTGMNQFGLFSPFGITGGYYYARLTQRF
ncbi:outer membrane receptor for ferrienterochelin and colicin [Caulobacter sp. AP07]|uniref:TonB-dependent receptor plug domain-containing protein n=1 Tax=Caulobacter sp. AP07 TaxID=1144304 RepID=UPI000271DF50|nr:TonB-dependent receptor [Caulobacter sp. AP07]EJL24052.1 outer membrane receptor for ferrienterochelin and colicin [Caulobacter sp. AP07]